MRFRLKRMVCSAVAALTLVLALPVGAMAAEADVEENVETPAESTMGFSECLSAIEAAAAAHEDRVEFGDGVSREVYLEVWDSLYWPLQPGRASESHFDAMMVRDRYAINRLDGYALAGSPDTPVLYAEIKYYFTADEVAKAEKKVTRVAEKAKAVKGRSARIKFIHDWVVRNAAQMGVQSKKWGKAKSYGVATWKVNTGGSTAQLLGHRGLCYSYTMTFLRICRAAGVDGITYAACKVRDGGWAAHAVAAVKDKAGADGKWRYVDVSWDDPIYRNELGKDYEPGKVIYKYYMKTKATMVKKGYKM